MKICVKCKVNPRGNMTGIWTCVECSKSLIENFVEPSGETYVYCLTMGREGRNKRVVYIGMTNDPVKRVAQHFSSRTKKFKTMKLVKSFDERSDAEMFERRAIDLLRPRFNVLVLDSDAVGSMHDEEIYSLFPVVQTDRRKVPVKSSVGTTQPCQDTTESGIVQECI